MRGLAGLLAVGVLAGGCSWFSWVPGIGGKDDKKAALEPAKLQDFAAEARIERLWRASIGAGLGRKYLRLNPVIVADRVYAADGYGVVEARDRFSGKRIWRTEIGKARKRRSGRLRMVPRLGFFDRRDPSFVGGGVGAGDGLVLLGTTDGELVALSAANGDEEWRAYVGSEILCRPVAGNGAVLAQTIDGRLLALEQEDGALRWSFDNQVPILTLRGSASARIRRRRRLRRLRQRHGQRPENRQRRASLGASGHAARRPFRTRPDGGCGRLAPSGGAAALCGLLSGAVEGPAPRRRRACVAAGDLQPPGLGFRLRPRLCGWMRPTMWWPSISRQPKWSGVRRGFTGASCPARRRSATISWVGDDEGYLHVLAQSDGRFLARRKLDGKGIRSGMAVADGRTLYVLTNSGALHALEMQTR